ncbi:hypothetical protein DY000_02001547 [Brassica cretica]|uniref:Uncharacterized protein n=1 Tax=Brassica cretica TaxID=69181 RepID=A0ABQ7C531_BRACR|nr:hypothetical protein DY000_02001547 [Brassica cretica]
MCLTTSSSSKANPEHKESEETLSWQRRHITWLREVQRDGAVARAPELEAHLKPSTKHAEENQVQSHSPTSTTPERNMDKVGAVGALSQRRLAPERQREVVTVESRRVRFGRIFGGACVLRAKKYDC